MWASTYTNRGGLKSVRDEALVLLVSATDASAVARSVRDALTLLLGIPVTVGSAGPVRDAGSLPNAYRQARRCLDALIALDGVGRSASVEDLGFLGLMLSDTPDVGGFIQNTIGPVLEYDRVRATDLVRTLDAYLETGSSPTRAAEKLHVHPNTVARRLERISELLSTDWQKPHRAVDVHLALRLHRIRAAMA
jgi:DNA-binding PucR family transcriptional regulator